MKYLVFIRGEESELRTAFTQQLMNWLNPDINTVRGIKFSMSDYNPQNKGERKAAASNVKKMVKKMFMGSFQEQFIVIDNPNENQQDWLSLIHMIEDLGEAVIPLGVQVQKNEHGDISGRKNEESPKVHVFKSVMYKYMQVSDDVQIIDALNDLESLVIN